MARPEAGEGKTPGLGWRETEEGMELQISFPGLRPDALSAEAWHRLQLVYERTTEIVSMVLNDQERMREQGRSIEGALSFFATHLVDMISFYQMLAGDLDPSEPQDDDFPF